MRLSFIFLTLLVALLISSAFAKTKHQKMFEDLYLKTEDELLTDDFIGMYALLVHRNIIGTFLIPGPGQEETWGGKPAFILNNPQLVNLSLALGKTKLARLIIAEVEKRRPRGFDNYPEYAGQSFPLPDEDDEYYPTEMTRFIPVRWIEHQFVGVTIAPQDGRPAITYSDSPAMSICVLNRLNDCFDALVENGYKPTITSNRTYILDPVVLAAGLNVPEILPKLVDIGAPIDMAERQHVLSSTSPYLMGCLRGHVEWVQAMLQMGYDIDEQHGASGTESGNGDTCLHAAAAGGHYALVHFLIQKGADLTIINAQDGQSAYSLSVQHHHRHVQALLADAFLQQRLPLPTPPTLRQRMNDIERQDEISAYLEGYMQRTGLTRQQVIDNMDVVPYDPYYDFDGTYDPDKKLGNPIRHIGSDQIAKSGASAFLVEFDGVMYTAGTHTYEAKMKEYLQREEEKIKERNRDASLQHDELMALVDESLKKQFEIQREELEKKKAMPKEIVEKSGGKPVDPNQTIDDYDHRDLFSTKIRDAFERKQNQTNSAKRSSHDEL